MRQFINVLVIVLLFAAAFGIGAMLDKYPTSGWGVAFVPLAILMVLWGSKIYHED